MDFPEAALWHAVILQALEDLRYEQLRQPALRWFLSRSGDVGSFRWVCQQIDLDPGAVRKAALDRSPRESFIPAHRGKCDHPAIFETTPESTDSIFDESPLAAPMAEG